MANSKRLITWFSDFARENKIWALSIAVPLLGAIPLYIYSMSIGQLPDFSLGDLTGVLIASFLTEMIVGTVMVVYLLFAGFAARKAVNGFYPDPRIAVSDSSNAPSPVALDTHRYLIRGNFIVGVTIFSVLSWFGLATKSFDSWLAPQHPGIARWAYALSLSSVALLVLVDWRRGWRLLKYTLFASMRIRFNMHAQATRTKASKSWPPELRWLRPDWLTARRFSFHGSIGSSTFRYSNGKLNFSVR